MGLFAGIDVAKDSWRWRYHRGRNGAAPMTREGSRFWSSAWRRRTRAGGVGSNRRLRKELLAALIAAGIEARRVNPRQVHHFAHAAGQLAKTDRIDARMLALFAERIRPASACAVRPRARATQGAGQPPQPVAADD